MLKVSLLLSSASFVPIKGKDVAVSSILLIPVPIGPPSACPGVSSTPSSISFLASGVLVGNTFAATPPRTPDIGAVIAAPLLFL